MKEYTIEKYKEMLKDNSSCFGKEFDPEDIMCVGSDSEPSCNAMEMCKKVFEVEDEEFKLNELTSSFPIEEEETELIMKIPDLGQGIFDLIEQYKIPSGSNFVEIDEKKCLLIDGETLLQLYPNRIKVNKDFFGKFTLPEDEVISQSKNVVIKDTKDTARTLRFLETIFSTFLLKKKNIVDDSISTVASKGEEIKGEVTEESTFPPNSAWEVGLIQTSLGEDKEIIIKIKSSSITELERLFHEALESAKKM